MPSSASADMRVKGPAPAAPVGARPRWPSAPPARGRQQGQLVFVAEQRVALSEMVNQPSTLVRADIQKMPAMATRLTSASRLCGVSQVAVSSRRAESKRGPLAGAVGACVLVVMKGSLSLCVNRWVSTQAPASSKVLIRAAEVGGGRWSPAPPWRPSSVWPRRRRPENHACARQGCHTTSACGPREQGAIARPPSAPLGCRPSRWLCHRA